MKRLHKTLAWQFGLGLAFVLLTAAQFNPLIPVAPGERGHAAIAILKTPATPAPPIVYVGALAVNLRADPSLSASVIAELPSGEMLMVLDTKVPWLKVRRPDGQEGWVNGSYLAPTTPVGAPTAAFPLSSATAAGNLSATPVSPLATGPAPTSGSTGGTTLRRGLYSMVAVPQLYVRSGPGLDYLTVASISRGTIVTVFARHRQWRYVRLPDGTLGWLNRTYLTEPAFGVPETNELAPAIGGQGGSGAATAPSAATIAPTPTVPPTPGGPSFVRPTPAGPSFCRGGDVFAGVHEPDRLVLISKCETVSGVVTELTFNPEDGDITFRLRVDPGYERFLSTGNYTHLRGFLQIELIPADQGSVYVPAVGQHVTVTGAWVKDTNNHDWSEIHPAWYVTKS
ncbi:MAG: SH3 domain-containing protein [Chloroflexi bacterium]|nr:SH3 domain-containing protein [Chloroflexota bacterium]